MFVSVCLISSTQSNGVCHCHIINISIAHHAYHLQYIDKNYLIEFVFLYWVMVVNLTWNLY
jgi:hypothetical protein